MTLEYVENLFHWGLQAMKTLGWAWRWAEWWVEFGDNWEPLLEVGQVEEDMTQEELRIIISSPHTRRDDAKKCRLAAFGAALRNREYDGIEGGSIALARALRAILSIQSLVGPLKTSEIDFFTEWLARIYRSKSPQLGYGDDQIPVAETWVDGSPVFFEDKSPKYKLGARPIPGTQKLKKGQIFESGIIEIDDYFTDDNPPTKESAKKTQRKGAMQKKTVLSSLALSVGEDKPEKTNPISSPNQGRRSRSKTRSSQMDEEKALECLEQMEKGPRRKSRTRTEKVSIEETLSVNTDDVSTKKVNRRRGRPPNVKREETLKEGYTAGGQAGISTENNLSVKKVGRRRGRPPNALKEYLLVEGDVDMENADNLSAKNEGRRRGRPSNGSKKASLIKGDIDLPDKNSSTKRRGDKITHVENSDKQEEKRSRSSRDNKPPPESNSIKRLKGRNRDSPPKKKRGRPPKKKQKGNMNESEEGYESYASKPQIPDNDDLCDTSEEEFRPKHSKRRRKKRPRISLDLKSIDHGLEEKEGTSELLFKDNDGETKPSISINRPRRSKSQKPINYDESSSPIDEEEINGDLDRGQKTKKKLDKEPKETVVKDKVPGIRKTSDVTKTIPRKRGRPPKKKIIEKETLISNDLDSTLSNMRIPKKRKSNNGPATDEITVKIPKKNNDSKETCRELKG